MGRRRRREQERALADLLSRSVREGERRGFLRAVTSAARYVLGRELSDTLAELAASGPERTLTALRDAAGTAWPDRWRSALAPILGSVMETSTESRAPVFGSFTLQNPAMRDYLDSYASELAQVLSATSYDKFERILRDALTEGLSVSDMAQRLTEQLSGVNRSRAETIARTELNRASSGASFMQAVESGVVAAKTWKATDDLRTRLEHRELDGQSVGIKEAFPNGEIYPGQHSVNCRCTLLYVLSSEAGEEKSA